MWHHKSRSVIPCISIGAFIISIANAQNLVGCDAVSCPTTYRQAHCTVGNTTLSELGITSFNTSLDISPFTWTLGIQETLDPANSSRASWDRNYFLGTPPSIVNLTSSSRGCALFFDGISANLSFPGVDRSITVGSCQNALSSLCVNDLLSQSQSRILSLMKDSTKTQTELNVCAELQSALQSQAPASCDAVASHDWGTIIVRELTGSSAAKLSQSSQNCTATTGKDYNLSLVQSTRYTGAIDYGVVTRLLLGITPILTVFYGTNDKVNTSAETHLSCLKVVETKDGEVMDAPQASTGVSEIMNKFWSWKLVIMLWAMSRLV